MIIDLPRHEAKTSEEKIAALEKQVKIFRDQVQMYLSTTETGSNAASGYDEKLAELSRSIKAIENIINNLRTDKHYTHTQSSAAAEWTVTHNLGKHPAVSVVDSAGTEVVGDVEYIDINTCKLIFSAAFSGKAYFN